MSHPAEQEPAEQQAVEEQQADQEQEPGVDLRYRQIKISKENLESARPALTRSK